VDRIVLDVLLLALYQLLREDGLTEVLKRFEVVGVGLRLGLGLE